MSMTDEPTPTTDTPETAEAQASAPQVDAPDAPAENSGAKTAAKGAPASFGLVFQAPDLTDVPVRTSRPRRATAGAAAAQSASAGDRDVAAAGRPTQENSERQDAPPSRLTLPKETTPIPPAATTAIPGPRIDGVSAAARGDAVVGKAVRPTQTTTATTATTAMSGPRAR